MKPPKTRNENIVVQEIENEILIYDLEINKAFVLNETSAIIYQLCNGKNSIADISNFFVKKLNKPINDEIIWLALDGLKKENLLENNEQFEIDFNGLSRRQVIKKVGLTSLIMLPIISSVVVPVSAASASLGALLASCTSPSQCQSGNCSSTTFPNLCCVPGSVGLVGANFCCSDPPSCDLACCSGSGTLIAPGGCPGLGFPLRVSCA